VRAFPWAFRSYSFVGSAKRERRREKEEMVLGRFLLVLNCFLDGICLFLVLLIVVFVGFLGRFLKSFFAVFPWAVSS
jgi:hypothetical protein